MGHIVLGAFFGVVLGALIDNITSKIQGDRNNRAWSLLFVVVQVAIIAFALYLAIQYRSPNFDSWLLETLTGYTFGILFLASQPTLGANSTTFLKF
jgi:sulfite exporter TauE/SafE